MGEADWRSALARALHGRVAVLCVGSSLRGDDGAGPALAAHLQVAEPWRAFDCGVAPENWIGPLCRFQPDVVVVADAIDFGAAPGTIRCWPASALANVGLTTHDASLAMSLDIIAEETGASALVVGVQPASAAFGQGLSPPVAAAVIELAAELMRLSRTPSHDGEAR